MLRNQFRTKSTKEHYRMYKSGKSWIYQVLIAGILFTGAGVAVTNNVNNVNAHADITQTSIPTASSLGFNITTDGQGHATITGYTGRNTSVDIPPVLLDNNGSIQTVTSIGNSAFFQNKLTSVTIPNTVTSIGQQAFDTNNLTTINIPDSVTTLGDGVFQNNKLTSFTLSKNITSIPETAFANNNLTSLVIPDTVTSINGGAFGNNQLTSVTLPESIGYNPDNMDEWFVGNNLTSIVLPNKALYQYQMEHMEDEGTLVDYGVKVYQGYFNGQPWGNPTTGIQFLNKDGQFTTNDGPAPMGLYDGLKDAKENNKTIDLNGLKGTDGNPVIDMGITAINGNPAVYWVTKDTVYVVPTANGDKSDLDSNFFKNIVGDKSLSISSKTNLSQSAQDNLNVFNAQHNSSAQAQKNPSDTLSSSVQTQNNSTVATQSTANSIASSNEMSGQSTANSIEQSNEVSEQQSSSAIDKANALSSQAAQNAVDKANLLASQASDAAKSSATSSTESSGQSSTYSSSVSYANSSSANSSAQPSTHHEVPQSHATSPHSDTDTHKKETIPTKQSGSDKNTGKQVDNKSKLPQTGDSTNDTAIKTTGLLVLIAGMLMFVLGRKRKQNEE